MPTLTRPDTVTIQRRVPGAVGPTGENTLAVTTTVAAGVPALVDAIPIESRLGGDISLVVEGIRYIQTHVLFIDGLSLLQIAGAAAGTVIVFGGQSYTVSANQKGAFIDLQVGDRVVDENGFEHLVLAVADYYDAMPCRQARLQRGRIW